MALEQYALTNGGNKIMNVVTWDGNTETWQPSPGITPRPLGSITNAEIGDTFDGTTLTKAPPGPVQLAEGIRRQILAKGANAFVANQTFLAIVSPTNPQSLAQIQALTKQMNGLYKIISGDLANADGT